jgi:hypothetical protein
MSDKKEITKLITPAFRVSFPHVFEPNEDAKTAKGKPKYQVSLLFPPDTDLKAMKKMAEAAVKDKWGDNPPKRIKTPFLDAGDYEYDGYEKGWTLVRCSTVQKPEIIDGAKQPLAESDFYPGCWARASVRAFCWEDDKGGKGVSFGFMNLQKLKDDESFSGRAKADDEFDEVEGAAAGDSTDSMFD